MTYGEGERGQELSSLDNVWEQQEEDNLGMAWREQFASDPQDLFEYVDREGEERIQQLESLLQAPKSLVEASGVATDMQKFPPGLTADIIGMGTWRLKYCIDGVVEFLVGRLEGSLRELLDEDLSLYPPQKWKDVGWDFIDSVDLHREWEGWAYVDIPDPEKGEPDYPRLKIENRIYCSRVFRKLHIEVAHRQDGLHILHFVMFPRYNYDIPILAMDLVVANDTVSLAIIDACPVRPRQQLPNHYLETMMQLQETFLENGEGSRTIPEWGKQIFSPLCVCIRPQTTEELTGFVKYSIALTRAHLLYSRLLDPVEPTSQRNLERLRDIVEGNRRFCDLNKQNKKTVRVLEVAMGKEMAQEYVDKMLFDFNPEEDVPFTDSSIVQLYRYFEENPDRWQDADRFMAIKNEINAGKAEDYLSRYLSYQAISQDKVSWGMSQLLETDPDFKNAVMKMMPRAEELAKEGLLGAALADYFNMMMEAAAVADTGGNDEEEEVVDVKEERPGTNKAQEGDNEAQGKAA